MSRHKAPTRRRIRAAARWLDWSPTLAELFRLAAADWTPPAQARLTGGAYRQTLSARFVAADGQVMTARIRLSRDPHTGERFITSEDLSIPLGVVNGGGA